MTQLYLDMDGVLMNYEGAITAHGIEHYKDGKLWIAKPRDQWPPEMIAADHAYIDAMALPTFWSSIEPMPDAHLLWSFARPLLPHVLTATPMDRPGPTIFAPIRDRIAQQKRESIWSHFDPTFPADHINVCLRHEKAAFAKPGAVLVDDTPANCAEWEAADGTAVLHTDAESTIKALREIYNV